MPLAIRGVPHIPRKNVFQLIAWPLFKAPPDFSWGRLDTRLLASYPGRSLKPNRLGTRLKVTSNMTSVVDSQMKDGPPRSHFIKYCT